jgi:hypothetical protein
VEKTAREGIVAGPREEMGVGVYNSIYLHNEFYNLIVR